MNIAITKPGAYTYILDQSDQEISVTGRFKLSGTASERVEVTIIHRAPHTTASVSLKATINDSASISLVGNIIVDEGARGTNSFLEERVLLLSPHSKAETIPNLEIKTNDVKCSHAATVGPIDPEQIFYLKSRGIDEATAKSLLAEGFLK